MIYFFLIFFAFIKQLNIFGFVIFLLNCFLDLFPPLFSFARFHNFFNLHISHTSSDAHHFTSRPFNFLHLTTLNLFSLYLTSHILAFSLFLFLCHSDGCFNFCKSLRHFFIIQHDAPLSSPSSSRSLLLSSSYFLQSNQQILRCFLCRAGIKFGVLQGRTSLALL